ncbi:MAG: peptidase M13 [Acidimicrobiales bacterium]|nr:MAG: peptidase M13 [Acidimicrobiales bacterium]
MKRSWLLVGLSVSLLWVWAIPASSAVQQSGSGSGSGLQLSGYDRAVRPQNDLFRFVNGTWLRTIEIPADLSRYGAFDILSEQAEQNLRKIIEDSASRNAKSGSEDQQIGDFYASFTDTKRRNMLGAAPLTDALSRIDKIANPADLVRYFGEEATMSLSSPIGLSIDQDAKNAKAYVPWVSQSGLTLPDRDYYLNSDPKFATARNQLKSYAARVLTLAGVADPNGAADSVLTLEKHLAQAQWTATHNRDATATYNKFTPATASAQMPGLDWKAYLDAAGIHSGNFVIAQPSFFTALGADVKAVPLNDWKRYLKFQLVDDRASYLSNDFVTASFEFHGRDLAGKQQIRPDWKRGVAAVNGALSQALGKRYVQQHFPADAKQRIDNLVSKLISSYRTSIDGLEWMSQATKVEAKKKLDKIAVKIGYPNTWKDYSRLKVTRDDLVGNVRRSGRLEYQRELNKLRKPVDRTEWGTTPQTVNAYYNPQLNDITFPAAILQPPFFDPGVDDAANYGAIGAVIGHEISHAFDDQGSKYDADGNLRDWWTPEDRQRFTARTKALSAQYSAYEPLAGQHINGELTLGENIADLSGLTVAMRAYRLSLAGKPAPTLDGFTGEQRFFLSWAQVWREKIRDEQLRSQLLSDPHSPGEFRANGVASNLPEFYAAFGVKEGDKLFRPPAQRVKIW